MIAKRVQFLVVHRFDRLTRSMSDWIRLQELFDDAGVKFVVVASGHSEMGSVITGLMNNVLAAFG